MQRVYMEGFQKAIFCLHSTSIQHMYRISSNSTRTSNGIRPRIVSAPAHSNDWGHMVGEGAAREDH